MPNHAPAAPHTQLGHHAKKHHRDHPNLAGRVGNLLNPLVAVVFVVASLVALRRRTLPEPLSALWGRTALAAVLAWLIVHPTLFWHSFPHSFDVSAHTAFFLVPGLALCALNDKWVRIILPLGLLYSVFMVREHFHTVAEVGLTALVVGPITWLCLTVGRRKSMALLNSPV